MPLTTKTVLTTSIPAAFCIAFWILALDEGNTPDGRWLFVTGFLAAVVAANRGRIAWLVHRQHVLEDQHAEHARQIRELQRKIQAVHEDVNARLITKAWRDAGHRAAIRSGNRQLFAVIDPTDETS